MDKRIWLSIQLEDIYPGIKRYYRPTNNLPLEPPYIIYTKDKLDADYSNNSPYSKTERFQVILVSNLPGEFDISLMLNIKGAEHKSSYTQKDLVHDVFSVSVK